ncbi:hypothetical protein SNE40_004443 [Patella caerulea]|uniref:Uncharacterized protein n=1 Tax=Patella caerulea TaxID=87958 RepID=A0AAN8PX70_PATCE
MLEYINDTINRRYMVTLIIDIAGLILHIISISTNYWAEGSLEGNRANFGLWLGCKDVDDVTTICSRSVFASKLLNNDNQWQEAAQILILIALLTLLMKILLVICLLLLNVVSNYIKEVIGVHFSLFGIYFTCVLLVLIMYIHEMADFRLSWSFFVAVSALVTHGLGCLLLFTDFNKSRWICKAKPKMQIDQNVSQQNVNRQNSTKIPNRSQSVNSEFATQPEMLTVHG